MDKPLSKPLFDKVEMFVFLSVSPIKLTSQAASLAFRFRLLKKKTFFSGLAG